MVSKPGDPMEERRRAIVELVNKMGSVFHRTA